MSEQTETPVKSLEKLRESAEKFRNRNNKPMTPEQIAAGKEYAAKLKQIERLESDCSLNAILATYERNGRSRKQFIPYAITLADGKKILHKIIETEILKQKRQFAYDQHVKEVISRLLSYYLGIGSDLGAEKGIYLFGHVGRGKTLLMRCFKIFTNLIEEKLTKAEREFTPRSFKMESCKTLVLDVANSKSVEVLRKYYKGNYCLDDLGAEDDYKLFGNDLNVMLDVITERRKCFVEQNIVTHVTSNMPPDEDKLIARYDARFESRCHEMFHFIYLDGKDYRKL